MGSAEDRTAKVVRAWDSAAPRYDRSMGLLERYWFSGGREWLAARVSGKVLEVAIGTGRNLDYYPANVSITGVELSPGMLAIARQRAAGLGRSVDLYEGNAEKLSFDDETFDTVVCALSLCSIPDPAAAIAEMRRVLKPGGQLLLLDHIGSSWRSIHVLQWLVEQITIRTAGEYWTRRPLLLVEAAGFEIVETERLKAGTIERVAARKPAPSG